MLTYSKAAALDSMLSAQKEATVSDPASSRRLETADDLEESSDSDGINSELQEHGPEEEPLAAEVLPLPPAWTEKLPLFSVFQHRAISLELPSREQCDFLIESYMHGYHPVVPVIHTPSFLKQVEEFWSVYEPGKPMHASPFLPLLLSILFAGIITSSRHEFEALFPSRTQEDLASQLHNLASKALRAADFPRSPTLESLTAYITCQSMWGREEEPLACCVFVGLAFRIAQMLGLHKDPKHFPSLSPVVAEVRRRVWWQLFHIDVLIAAASGLPPIIEKVQWDVQELSELKDEYIGTPEGAAYEEAVARGERIPDSPDNPHHLTSTSMVSAASILAIGKHRSSGK